MNLKDELNNIDSTLLLPNIEYSILFELNKAPNGVFARDIAEELDVSYQLVGKRAKRMDNVKHLIQRKHVKGRALYIITEEAKNKYFN